MILLNILECIIETLIFEALKPNTSPSAISIKTFYITAVRALKHECKDLINWSKYGNFNYAWESYRENSTSLTENVSTLL